MLYLDIAYIYLQENVEAGLRAAPADIVAQLLHSEKLQYATATLLGTTVMSVKFSFLFLFRHLIQQQKKMLIWWWCIFVFLIPTSAILIFSDLISCPYFDERILGQSFLPGIKFRFYWFICFPSSPMCHPYGSCQAKWGPKSVSHLGYCLGCVT